MTNMKSKDIASFKQCYASIHMASELAEKMAGEDGRSDKFTPDQVHELKRLMREASCAAGAIHSTHDGR